MNLIKYEKNFTLKMSNKDEFIISEKWIAIFEECERTKQLFKLKDWTLINPSFFVSATPSENLEMSDYEAKKITEKELQVWKWSLKQKIKWLEIMRNWWILFN